VHHGHEALALASSSKLRYQRNWWWWVYIIKALTCTMDVKLLHLHLFKSYLGTEEISDGEPHQRSYVHHGHEIHTHAFFGIRVSKWLSMVKGPHWNSYMHCGCEINLVHESLLSPFELKLILLNHKCLIVNKCCNLQGIFYMFHIISSFDFNFVVVHFKR